MTYHRVSLENIDLEDQRFRISERLDSLPLLEALRQIGQLNPVCLQARKGSPLAVIAGFRRVQALRSLGQKEVLAGIWHDGEKSDLELFRIALWDNLSHRELSPLEKARVLTSLKNFCDVPHDALVEIYLPILGMQPHKNTLRTYLSLHALHPELREMLNDGRITLACGERLSRAPLSFQNQITEVLQRVRWSASLQRETLDLVEEVAVIAGLHPGEVLRESGIRELLQDGNLSPFQRGERIHRLLYRRRNPRLCKTEERFRERQKELRLPDRIRLSPTPFFESAELRVEFSARSPRDFRETAQALERAAQTLALEALFSIADCGLQIADCNQPGQEDGKR